MNKMTIEHELLSLLAISVAGILAASTGSAANLSDKDKQFLAGYEKVHTALAADDLGGAKAAASELGDVEADLAKSNSLKEARVAFEKLSTQAKQLAAGQPGYHVFHCPMLKKDWVQTSTTTANPYGGKGMVSCGEMQK
jgi:hypothetical protein